VRDIPLKVASGNPDVLSNPAPDVIFKGFGDNSLDFELRVWTSNKVDAELILKSDLNFAILDAFRAQHRDTVSAAGRARAFDRCAIALPGQLVRS